MNTQKIVGLVLEGVDSLGFKLDEMGITNKLNRHNIAAFLMAEQKHLEGEWDSLQAKVDRRRSQIEHLTQHVENRADAILSPVLTHVNRFRASH
ncbi:hypothetical protein [Marinobacter sp.]|uniref:hypothetical protein n=1 Tax=Marinobacter sp. TaxID=50741 RepID=UPI0035678DE5